MSNTNKPEAPARIQVGGVVIDRRFFDGRDVYNEGDAEEEFILGVLKSGKDPVEVLRQDDRWPVLYQLSPARRNIVLPMDLRPGDRLLEVGSGMGAVTGAMAGRVKHVDCVDLSARRCLANAWRNKAFDNITIYQGNFQQVELEGGYDVATLIGVLEYAPMFFHGEEKPDVRMLEMIWDLMKPGGRLYIAIENRLGMKYFAGAAEDHYGRPYVGITGYPEGGARTYSRAELTDLLRGMGWKDIYFYYPYPDYKLPDVIYSDDMPRGDYLPPVADYNCQRLKTFDESAAMLSMMNPDDWKMFANSFLVEAIKGK